MKDLHICHVVSSLSASAGGPSRVVPPLCHHLAKLNTTVVLSAVDTGENVVTAMLTDSQRYTVRLTPKPFWNPLQKFWFPGFKAHLKEECIHNKISLIHGHGLWTGVNHIAAQVAKELGIYLVTTPHGMLEPWALQHHAWRKRVAWALYQKKDLTQAHTIHATSQAEALQIRKLGFRQAITLIPNGIETPPKSATASIDDKNRTILFLSRIHPKKGILDLVRAWAISKKEGWQIIIAGPDEGGHRAKVEALIQKLKLEKYFHFVGSVEDDKKWALYQQSDLFVLPSYSENFGLVIGEALAAGLPVITTQETPWRELKTEHCGWWIKTGPDALAKTLKTAMNLSPLHRKAMGQRGKKLVKRKYAWAKIAVSMKKTYKWIIQGGSMPEWIQKA